MTGGHVARGHHSGIASLVAAATVLVIAPDREFRRSLEFALEVEGFSISSHASLAEAEASPRASEAAACAVIDDAALRTDCAAHRSLDRLLRPIILLADGFSSAQADTRLIVLTKPWQGNALIELVQAISASVPAAT